MPKIKVDKKTLEGMPKLPPGVYHVRLDGFKPKKSKKGDSVNLNPVLKVINDPNGLNDRLVFDNLNSTAGWVMKDFCHGLGVPMEGSDHDELPGEFGPPNEADPEKWVYQGPLIGKTGRLEVADGDNGKGGTTSKIKRYFCNIPGCTEKHSESLL